MRRYPTDSRSPASIDEILEAVCRRGCRDVREIIARAERGDMPADVASLSEPERRSVLCELKSIMAVYAGVCSVVAQRG
jgi:hypothetical protein